MRRRRGWWLVCAVGWAAGCGAARTAGEVGPAAVDSGPIASATGIGFEIGAEEMTLDIQLRGLSIGRLRVAVGDRGAIAGRRAVIVRSVVDSAGLLSLVKDLTWELETTMDLDRGFPIEESSRYAARIEDSDEQGAESRHYRDDETVHNFHSVAMAVRGWNPITDERLELQVRILGRFRVTLGVAGRAYDRSFGRPVLRIHGVAHFDGGHAFTVLVSDDASRVPLRVDFDSRLGRFSAVLIHYRGARWQWPVRRRLQGVFPG